MSFLSNRILITGGAGYIGSFIAQKFIDEGQTVFVLDNLSSGSLLSLSPKVHFFNADVRDRSLLKRILNENSIGTVIHLAAKISVEESNYQPLEYYDNNVIGTVSLIKACKDSQVRRIIFSSTAGVYQESNIPVSESSPLWPLSPYAKSKLMAETILQDVLKSHPFDIIVLRYFNVAGAGESLGILIESPTHLVNICALVACGVLPEVKVFGRDYQTPDGTAIRDYIHVMDLAEIHFLIESKLPIQSGYRIFNCGYGTGFSVMEVIKTMSRISGKELKISVVGRRSGDPMSLVANSNSLQSAVGWSPEKDQLERICRSAYHWELKK